MPLESAHESRDLPGELRLGYCRIQGELKALGHRVASTTVANVLKANGIKPAPDRPSSWKSFLKAHWGQVAATDFFTTEAWTVTGLRTFYVLFFVELRSRRVKVAGITTNPTDWFMGQAFGGGLLRVAVLTTGPSTGCGSWS